MVTRDGDNLVIRSVVSGDALFGTEEKHEESVFEKPADEEPVPEEFLPQTRVKRNYSCSSCEFATQNPRIFLYHLRDEHDQKFKIYECPRCLYASRHSQKLHRHMHMVHVLGAGKRKPSSRSLRRLKPKPEVKPPPPPPADTEFTLSDDGTSILYKCSACPFKSKSQNALVKHERVVHLKKKFFRCSKCDYATHIRARYTKHVKYHSMPMIKCDICDFRTPYKWNLERHNKNHQGGGAFQCFMCNFTADIKQSLTVHELNHHTDGAARRRYKVGSSDVVPTDDNLDILHFESKEANVLSKVTFLARRRRAAGLWVEPCAVRQ